MKNKDLCIIHGKYREISVVHKNSTFFRFFFSLCNKLAQICFFLCGVKPKREVKHILHKNLPVSAKSTIIYCIFDGFHANTQKVDIKGK